MTALVDLRTDGCGGSRRNRSLQQEQRRRRRGSFLRAEDSAPGAHAEGHCTCWHKLDHLQGTLNRAPIFEAQPNIREQQYSLFVRYVRFL